MYIACRSAERAQTAIADIKKGGSVTLYGKMVYNPATTSKPLGTVDYINLDLADLTNVEQCAAEFLTREKRLDILFANAGVMALYVPASPEKDDELMSVPRDSLRSRAIPCNGART